jgi:hypothetical protein
MKAFIDRIFKKRKKDAEQIEENKELLSEQIETSIKKYVEEVKQDLKQEEVYTKPGHYFNDCNCVKCVRWRNQDAK